MLKSHRESKPILVGELISTISSIVRSHKPAFKRFAELKGLEHTLDIVKFSNDDRNCAKAARMLATFNFILSSDKDETTVFADQKSSQPSRLGLRSPQMSNRAD